MRIVICGAGIAGACAALALQEQGIEALVVERSDKHVEAGAGIQLAPNATRLLYALGLRTELLECCGAPEAIEIRDGATDKLGYRIPLGNSLQQRFGAPYLVTHRGDLLAALWQQLQEKNSLLLNREVVGVLQEKHGVVAQFRDGSALEGDLLIGADGVHSLIRKKLFPDAMEPSGSRYIVWRLQCGDSREEAIDPKKLVCVWCGNARHVVSYALPKTSRRKEQINVVAITERNAVGQYCNPGEEVAAAFANWKPMGNWLEGLTHHPWRKRILPEGGLLSHWSQGSIGLLGDACHPMLPFLAQGAGMAVEDAFSLARSLKKGDGLKGLDRPQRLIRLRRVQKATDFQSQFFHRRGWLGNLAWHPVALLLGRCFPETLRDMRLGWLYKSVICRDGR